MGKSFGFGKRWCLVYTKPRQEDIAVANLRRQNYEIYIPQIRVSRIRRGSRLRAIEPLFPRYLFIHLDSQFDNWAPIRSTLGVTALVRFGTEPAWVPDEFIDFLVSRQDADGLHEWAEPVLVVGARARVVSGPLMGYEGVLVAKSGRERVVVLLDMVGGKVRASIGSDQVEPAGP